MALVMLPLPILIIIIIIIIIMYLHHHFQQLLHLIQKYHQLVLPFLLSLLPLIHLLSHHLLHLLFHHHHFHRPTKWMKILLFLFHQCNQIWVKFKWFIILILLLLHLLLLLLSNFMFPTNLRIFIIYII